MLRQEGNSTLHPDLPILGLDLMAKVLRDPPKNYFLFSGKIKLLVLSVALSFFGDTVSINNQSSLMCFIFCKGKD